MYIVYYIHVYIVTSMYVSLIPWVNPPVKQLTDQLNNSKIQKKTRSSASCFGQVRYRACYRVLSIVVAVEAKSEYESTRRSS